MAPCLASSGCGGSGAIATAGMFASLKVLQSALSVQIANYLLTLKSDPRASPKRSTLLTAHSAGVTFVPQLASRFQRSGVLFRPLTDQLIRIETALFACKDQMRTSVMGGHLTMIATFPDHQLIVLVTSQFMEKPAASAKKKRRA
jgi:hypothetical protein